MSFLSAPPHSLAVQMRKRQQTAHGPSLVPVGDAVTVRCAVRALSAAERSDLGLTTETTYRVLARNWPGDVLSLIRWDDADWEPIGDPLHFDGSPLTAHVEVRMRRATHG